MVSTPPRTERDDAQPLPPSQRSPRRRDRNRNRAPPACAPLSEAYTMRTGRTPSARSTTGSFDDGRPALTARQAILRPSLPAQHLLTRPGSIVIVRIGGRTFARAGWAAPPRHLPGREGLPSDVM